MKDKHNRRRSIAAAKAQGTELPAIGKRARLALAAQAPSRHQITWVIGKPKLVAQPAVPVPASPPVVESPAVLDPRATPLEDMNFSAVVFDKLVAQGLLTAGAISDHDKKIPGLGPQRVAEVKAKLNALGLPCNLPANK